MSEAGSHTGREKEPGMAGVHLQAMFVEPVGFFTDLADLGVAVEYPT